MSSSELLDLMREAVWIAIRLGSPMLLGSMAVGILVAIFQAATQIHEQTLSFIPKLLLIVVICLIGGSWMLRTLQEFTRMIFQQMV